MTNSSRQTQPIPAAGRNDVTAQPAAYEIDLDAGTIHQQLTGESGGVQLRRDAERIDLLELLECPIGMRMILHMPGVDITTRLSTRVATIVRLHSDERR